MALPLADQPRDLLLGPDNDLVIPLQHTYGVQAVAQSCRIAIQIFAGEWFLDLDVGIPYWQKILAQKPATAIAAARIAFRSELLAVDGVLSVTKLEVSFDRATRALIVSWQVMTGLGETPADSIALAIGGG